MKKLILLLIGIYILFASPCDKKLFSLSTQGDNAINLQQIITDLSDTCHLNVIVTDDLAKKKLEENIKYIKLKNMTLDQFLDFLLGKNGFFYSLKDNLLTISYIKTKNFKIDYVNSIISGNTNFSASTTEDGGTNTLTTQFSFDFFKEFSDNINNILKAQVDKNFQNPAPIIDKTSGLVTITGTKQQLQRVQDYIDELNKRLHKEVLIDVKIYSVKLTDSHQTGVNWSKFNLGMNTGDVKTRGTAIGTTILGSTTFNLTGLLDFLSTYGQVNSISNPKITTLNNQKAIITVGSVNNYSYDVVTTDANGNLVKSQQIDSKFIGILLDITPEISDKGIIMMTINPSISSLAPIQTKPNLPPDTIQKSLNTIIRVKDGDTIILGGLITDETAFQASGVPVLKEIPIIKYLFSYKEKISKREELIFVITPHIINLNKVIDVKNIGYKANKKLPKLGDL
jgi:general secretion pathway protein D